MRILLTALLLGCATSFLGFLPGVFLSSFITADRRGGERRLNGGLLGFAGGLLIAFVCFEILPRAFSASGVFITVSSIFLGIIIFACLENETDAIAGFLGLRSPNKYIRTGILLAIGVGVHNIPEGMAIGSLLNVSPVLAVKMAAILLIHCAPEALAAAVPFREGGVGTKRLLLYALPLTLPLGAGAVLGALFSNLSPVFESVFLGFSGGVMMYIACGEIIPQSKSVWKGCFSTLCAGMGFIAGIIITSIL